MTVSSGSDQVVAQYVSQHGKTWPYWFRKMGRCLLAPVFSMLAYLVVFMYNTIAAVLVDAR